MKRLIKLNTKRTNAYILGVFLLVWSMNGYFIGGNSLKLAFLLTGFGIIMITTVTLKIGKKSVSFFIKSFFLLLIYWLLAFLNNQHTTDVNTVMFDVICLLLLNSGFIASKNSNLFNQVNPKIVLLICTLTVLGTYLFIKYQTLIAVTEGIGASRVGLQSKEDNINAVGLAYVNAIIFFMLFVFLTKFQLKKHFKWLLLFSMMCCLFIIFSAGARGALLFVLFVLFLNYFYKLKSIPTSILLSFKLILLVVIIFIAAYFIKDLFPVFEVKFEKSIARFESLFEVNSNFPDSSANERLDMYVDFYENLNEFVLFGRNYYKPYPHNQFMEIIMRWGVFFGGVLMFFTISNLKKSLKKIILNISVTPFEKVFLVFFLFAFFQSMTSMSLEMNRVLWLSMGFVFAMPNNKK